MHKTLAIPAAEWMKAETAEQRQALVEKYTVPMTDEEIAARQAEESESAAMAEQARIEEAKAKVHAALEEIDRKSIRSLREGNSDRLAVLEAEAVELRKVLK
jgi:uncharacterized protein YqfA (UPF0365 family)